MTLSCCEYNPIILAIQLGTTKIPTKEILDDFGINATTSVVVETDTIEVLNRIQTTFANEFERSRKLKESNI